LLYWDSEYKIVDHDDKSCEEASFLQIDRSPAQKTKHLSTGSSHGRPPWHQKMYIMLPYRKSGYEMTAEAWGDMQSAHVPPNSSGLPAPKADLYLGGVITPVQTAMDSPIQRVGYLGLSSSGLKIQTLVDPSVACFAQFARNPFEMVVSGYLYDSAQSEIWQGQTFNEMAELVDRCGEFAVKGWMDADLLAKCSSFCQQFPPSDRICEHVLEATAVLTALGTSKKQGSSFSFLPNAKDTETFATYLQRVDLDVGLMAEYGFLSALEFDGIVSDKDLVDSHPCSTSVCFNDFYDKCNDTWQHVLGSWEIPKPQHSVMLQAATGSCPGANPKALDHSSAEAQKANSLSHPPEHEMVKRLRHLDRIFLNGTIAALEEHIGCPVSGKYKIAEK
jgi:hypothetical protein